MDIVNYMNITHPQNCGLWWKIGIKTNEHSDYRNKLLHQISISLKIGASGEKFSFLTKSAYHWTRSIPDLLDDNSLESQISSNLTDFPTDHSVCATQNTEDQTKADQQAVILVAADADSDFISTTSILKHQCKLTQVLNGAQAVELYKTNRSDLILMDMKMPIMGGLEATQKIREMTGIFPSLCSPHLYTTMT